MFSFDLYLAGVELWWPGLVLLGLLIGFLTGMFGVGGGFLLTPFLNIFFGIPYPTAVGTGLAQIFCSGAFSAWKHWRNKNVDVFMGAITAGGAICGTEIGIRILGLIETEKAVALFRRPFLVLNLVINGLFLILMTSVLILIWWETSRNDAGDEVASIAAQSIQGLNIPPLFSFPHSRINSLSLWLLLGLSLLVGVLTGLLGIGGGFVNFPLLVYVIGVPTTVAVGTGAFQILFSTGYGALRHIGQGHVELLLVGFLLSGSLIGVQLGIRLSRFVGGLKIRRYFAWVIALGVGVILWDLVRKTWF